MQLGSTAIGLKTKEGVVLAVEKRITSPLLVCLISLNFSKFRCYLLSSAYIIIFSLNERSRLAVATYIEIVIEMVAYGMY